MSAEETSSIEGATEGDPVERLDGEGTKPGRLTRFTGRVKGLSRGTLLSALLVLLAVVSAALTAGPFYFQYRQDRATDGAAAEAAVSAASDGTVAILSYSPETLDRDFSSARSHLTGDFLSYYNQFTEEIVAPAATQKSLNTTAAVRRAAVSELHPDSAVVLVFVNQSTTSADRPEPTLAASSVLVTLTKADGKWLISSFTPV